MKPIYLKSHTIEFKTGLYIHVPLLYNIDPVELNILINTYNNGKMGTLGIKKKLYIKKIEIP